MPPRTRTPSRRPAKSNLRQINTARSAVHQRPSIVVKPQKLSDFNSSVNWGIHGDSGSGKTVLSSFAPNAYFLSTEKGVVAAQRVGSTAQVLTAPDWYHVEANIEWADQNLGPDNWLIVDSSTKMQELLIQHLLRIQHEDNAARDLDMPQLQDYPKWQRMFMRFTSHIVDAPYNSIFIATSMRKEDPDGDDIVMPNIVGKDYTIAQNWCAEMDIVSCLRVRKRANLDDPREAILLNDTFPPYFAKDRYRALPSWELIEEGHFDIIRDMIDDILTLPEDVRKAAKADA